MSGGVPGRALEAPVPVFQQRLKLVAQLRQLHEAGFDRGEFLLGERPNLAARRQATVAFTQNDRQLGEREAEGERASHQQDAPERRLRVNPVIGR